MRLYCFLSFCLFHFFLLSPFIRFSFIAVVLCCCYTLSWSPLFSLLLVSSCLVYDPLLHLPLLLSLLATTITSLTCQKWFPNNALFRQIQDILLCDSVWSKLYARYNMTQHNYPKALHEVNVCDLHLFVSYGQSCGLCNLRFRYFIRIIIKLFMQFICCTSPDEYQ